MPGPKPGALPLGDAPMYNGHLSKGYPSIVQAQNLLSIFEAMDLYIFLQNAQKSNNITI